MSLDGPIEICPWESRKKLFWFVELSPPADIDWGIYLFVTAVHFSLEPQGQLERKILQFHPVKALRLVARNPVFIRKWGGSILFSQPSKGKYTYNFICMRFRSPSSCLSFHMFPAIASRPALRPTQPPIQGCWGLLLRRESGRDVKLTTHVYLVPRLRTGGAIRLFLHTSLWHGA